MVRKRMFKTTSKKNLKTGDVEVVTEEAGEYVPPLTIGMAHHNDFHGVYFTVHSAALYNKYANLCDLIIVDNSPHTEDGEYVRRSCEGEFKALFSSVKYIPIDNTNGTSLTRNRIFEESESLFTLVTDCHVIFPAGVIDRTIQFIKDNPNSKNIYSGPLMYGNHSNFSTHYNDELRSQMWGTWGQAWQCECSKFNFSVLLKKDKAYAIKLKMGQHHIENCPECGKVIFSPETTFAGHEKVLLDNGHHRLGIDDEDGPFEIPGQGLGCFFARTEDWLGFHPLARGFGGEELYIHELYRQQRRKAICLPWLKWLHRFARPGGANYPHSVLDKVRNYILEAKELSKPHYMEDGVQKKKVTNKSIGLSIDIIKEHWVDSGIMPKNEFYALLKDPEQLSAITEPQQESSCIPCSEKKYNHIDNLEELYQTIKNTPRDLNEHMETLVEYAKQCDRVLEVSERKESTIAFLYAQPQRLISYQTEQSHVIGKAAKLSKTNYSYLATQDVVDFPEVDLLFFDPTNHSSDLLLHLLDEHCKNVKRYIILHDTDVFRDVDPLGGRGFTETLSQFMQLHKEWTILRHDKHQFGLTILGCQPQDKPKVEPSMLKMAGNFTKAMINFAKNDFATASKEIYEKRLLTCSLCPHRLENKCTICGCFVDKKAAIKDDSCPLDLWPKSEKDEIKTIFGNRQEINQQHQQEKINKEKIASLPPIAQKLVKEYEKGLHYLPLLQSLCSQFPRVSEIQAGKGVSTLAIFASHNLKRYNQYGTSTTREFVKEYRGYAKDSKIVFLNHREDILELSQVEPCELMLINDYGTLPRLKLLLNFVAKYTEELIIIKNYEEELTELSQIIENFTSKNPFVLQKDSLIEQGLIVLERKKENA